MANTKTMGVNFKQLITTLSALVFLATSTLFLSGQAHGKDVDLCAGAEYAALCRTVVGGEKSPHAALETTVNRLISETKKAIASAARLPPKDAPVCKEMYDEALYDLKESLQVLKNHDMGSFNVKLSAVISFAETCKDSFEEASKPFPLATQNELIQHLASIALYIATLIP